MGESRRRKLARDTTDPEEIFPAGHGPVQSETVAFMHTLLGAVREALPNFDVTIFLSEREVLDGTDRLPRFNYGSTADRPDMLAVLKAFVAKNEVAASALDKINDPPPSGARQ